jgi:ribosome modulation factor
MNDPGDNPRDTNKTVLAAEQAKDNAYLDGQDACMQGILRGDCPHAVGPLRSAWLDGWFDFYQEAREPWEEGGRICRQAYYVS